MPVKVESKEKCYICNVELDKFDLLLHFEKQHSTEENDDTKDQKLTKNSKIDSQNDKGVKCEICDKYFKDNKSLGNHMRKVHKKDETVPQPQPNLQLPCNICAKTYSNLPNLQNHMMRCHDIAPKSGKEKSQQKLTKNCNICEQTIVSRSLLDFQRHMDSHTGIKSQCNFCGKSFSAHNIKIHIERIHL